jgi:hypothetical protein
MTTKDFYIIFHAVFSLLGEHTKPLQTVLRIRIRMFLGLLDPDPDPLVRCMDPDPDPNPSIIQPKIVRETLISTFCLRKMM